MEFIKNIFYNLEVLSKFFRFIQIKQITSLITSYRIFLILIIIHYFFSSALYSQDRLQFKFTPDSKQKIECTINGKLFVNSVFYTDYKQEYKTIRTYGILENNVSDIEESNFVYNIDINLNNNIREIADNYTVTYKKDPRGVLFVKYNALFPTLRNIPSFPDIPVKPGDVWEVNGFEVQDFFNNKEASIFPITAKHRYIELIEKDGKRIAKFSYEYSVSIINSPQYRINKRIDEINGISKTVVLFDIDAGTRIEEVYSRNYYISTGGNIHQFVDGGKRVWSDIELLNKNQIKTDIEEDLKKNNIYETTVESDDRGIKITLENILFEADSAVLRDTEATRLQKISDLLKKYKDRGLLIVGHTTDRGSSDGRKKLSLERAKSVLDYLTILDAVNTDKSSYAGKGGEEPIADNNTPDGLKRNRRVEIFILEE